MSQENGTKVFRTFLQKGHGEKRTRHTSSFSVLLVTSFPVPQKPHSLFDPYSPKAHMSPERNSKDRIRKVLG